MKDVVAGFVASIVIVANIVSFAGLMFPGDLGAGVPLAVWAMLVGSCVGGVWIALATSLPPLATGIDSPTGTFLVLISASASTALVASGASPEAIVTTVMLVFSAATVMSGASLYLIGVFRWGPYFRFVPYFVVGGFLAATGVFLLAGGVRMTTGVSLALEGLTKAAAPMAHAKLGGAVVVLLVLIGVRRFIASGLAMPAALLAMCIASVALLHALGLAGRDQGWFLPSLGTLSAWSPFEAAKDAQMTWRMVAGLMPELVAVALVALISLVTKVSSLEVARQASGDLNREFRVHGLANLAIAPLGGIACSVQTGTSRLLEQAGGASRMCGVVAALVLGAVATMHLDLPGLIPIPIMGGLVFYLGYSFLVDALRRLVVQRAWMDLTLALLIMAVCVRYGYLFGVLAGIVGACVLFALNSARLGVVRRHASRVAFASHVDRSAEASDHLRRTGDAIQIYWLSGYIFFGSSEGLFERIRHDIDNLGARVEYVILDFGMVPAMDSSAIASLAKLRNVCDALGVTLVFSALSRAIRAAIEQGGLCGGARRHRAFGDLNLALSWCEDNLVAKANVGAGMDVSTFEHWLQRELGEKVRADELIGYFHRQDIAGAQVLYHEGEPADTIDLVAVGNLAIDIDKGDGESVRVRRITKHTVLGEMGFVRRTARSATVSTDSAATVFTLTRASFERMRRERPDLAAALDDFLMRSLADRLDAVNRAAAAWGR